MSKKIQGHIQRLEALQELYPEIIKWDQLLEDLGMKNRHVRSSLLKLRAEVKEHIHEIKHVIRKETKRNANHKPIGAQRSN